MKMKRLELRKATGRLVDYARDAMNEPLVLTVSGGPVATLVPVQADDWERFSLSTNPDFLDLIEQSRRRQRDEGGMTLEEVNRLLGLTEEDLAEAAATLDALES